MVTLSEWDWEHSAVFLGIHVDFPLPNDSSHLEAFEGPIGLQQVDEIIAKLVACRDEAKRQGITTAREVPAALVRLVQNKKTA